ncbi:hypothetical protein OJAV_G00021850 [Oryzias javanicus]|uniref:Uncharacterized protein n=1 Tax=Oryzias javanicus TaxID=123683 RepID=A0A3S2PRV8_ORYJA|nr:hypothetical protein OJAV_G00021850 [Oryzias javanicus]
MFRINFLAEFDLQQNTLTLSVFDKSSLERKFVDAKTVHASRCLHVKNRKSSPYVFNAHAHVCSVFDLYNGPDLSVSFLWRLT